MEDMFNGPNDTVSLAYEALRDIAEDLPLVDILNVLRDFYRAALDDPLTPSRYAEICDVSIRALDAALWRLETESV